MASNGLVANPTKTTLMILNFKGKEKVIIKIGEALISQVNNAKLLGVKIEKIKTGTNKSWVQVEWFQLLTKYFS